MNAAVDPAPLVSVGIPTLNRRELLRRAIESVLAQSYPALEVIVSDNASTDSTGAVVEGFNDPRIRYLRQSSNIGMIGNFNACLNAAAGSLFIMLSDDDVLEPDAIEALTGPFRGSVEGLDASDVGVSWSPVTIIGASNDSRWTTAGGARLESGLRLVCGLFNGDRGPRFCSLMVRTADARAAGGYASDHRQIADVGNWSQIALRYRWAYCVQRPVARYTMHTTSVTATSTFHDWILAGTAVSETLESQLRERGDHASANAIRRAARNNISNLVITVLMQRPKKTWFRSLKSEWRALYPYLLTPMVARRAVVDGWKVLRIRSR